MGARLTKLAYAYAVDVPLNPTEFRLLAFMCLTALDDDAPPRYFDSREASAIALGRRVPDATDDDARRERAAAFQAVKTAISGLVALGAIDRIKTGRAGQRSEYALRIDLAKTRSTTEFRKRSGVGRTYPSGVGRAYPTGKAEPTPEGYAGPTPKEPLRNHKDQKTGITLSHSPISLAQKGAA